MRPAALLVHVPDINAALRWYQSAFPDAAYLESGSSDVKILKIEDFQIEFVPSDTKVSSGKAGTVLYWSVSDLDEVIVKIENLGAKLYRGPILIEEGLRMCQLEDPFGNLIGLRGN